MNKRVSVIITTYGVPQKLHRAIESVLQQEYPDIEVIVVDDNSPDSDERFKTENLMQMYAENKKIVYLKHIANLNGAAARNTGILHATGEYVAFLDNDDVYLVDKIKESVAFLEENPDCGGVLNGVLLSEQGVPIRIINFEMKDSYIEELMLGKLSLGTGSNLFLRKKVIDKVGLFDTEFLRYQDVEYFIRANLQTKFGVVNDTLIIKDSEVGKTSSYKKMKKATELYMRKFDNIAQSFGEEKYKLFLIRNYSNLFEWALESCDLDGIKKEYAVLMQFEAFPERIKEMYKNRYRIMLRRKIIRALKDISITSIALSNIRKTKNGIKAKGLFSNDVIKETKKALWL